MTLRVAILGSGAIGTFVGICMDAAGARVSLLGRPHLRTMHTTTGIEAHLLSGRVLRPSNRLQVVTHLSDLPEVDVAFLTTKTLDGVALGTAWRARTGLEGPPMWVLQNGIEGGRPLRESGVTRAHDGVVTFNVHTGDGRFQQATTGTVLLARRGPRLLHTQILTAFQSQGVDCEFREDMQSTLRGKLLLNLNNGVCALTGLNIRASIEDRDARRCFALAAAEALRVFRGAGLPVARVGRVPPALLPTMLRLPDAVLRRLAPAFVRLDPMARSSTLRDLCDGRPTEARDLHGAVVKIGMSAGVPAPINAYITNRIESMANAGPPHAFFSPGELLGALQQAETAARG